MLFAATWMQLEILIPSEVSQKEEDKYHMVSLMWTLKYSTNEPIYKTDSQTYRTDLWLPRGREEGLGVWCKLLHLEWISNGVLLCSTGKYIQCLG